MIVIVPRGAEAAAVRRGKPSARVVEIAAGAGSVASLPDDLHDGAIVVVGLCGALRDLRVGDVAVYRSVASGAGEIWPTAAGGSALIGMPDVRFVRACTIDHVVTTKAERAHLAARYDADVVDMEGAPLAAELARRGLDCAMVRVVSDDAERDLPAIAGVISPQGNLRVGRLIAAALRSPRSAFAFVRGARRALRRLEQISPALLQGDDGGSSSSE